ncbi:hypothetical protein [Rhizobium sp. N122]|uniref:hypothetical protein n=1 Tax=Rhizobium sp. N122 TaxID=1764272 RepID=UPI001179E363|nr:hypothetical protein [Rhizobium sp. N122]
MAFIGVFPCCCPAIFPYDRMRQAAIPTFHSIIFADAPIARWAGVAHEYCGRTLSPGIFLLPYFQPGFALDPACRRGFCCPGL